MDKKNEKKRVILWEVNKRKSWGIFSSKFPEQFLNVTDEYALTNEEISKLQKCRWEQEKIDEDVEILYSLQKEIRENIKAIQFIEDKELSECIQSKIKYTVSCKIDRIDKKVCITLHDCNNRYDTKCFFDKFIKDKFEMSFYDNDNSPRMEITIALSQRDALIAALKNDHQSYVIHYESRMD